MLGRVGVQFRLGIASSLKLHLTRAFSATPSSADKPLPPRSIIDEADIEENFVKGTGPGGQKINKTSSAVQLIHRPTGIIVKCQETRSRTQNRKIARKLLADRIEFQDKGEESRIARKAAAAKKKKASADKKKRRKYKQLDEAKQALEDKSEDSGPPERESLEPPDESNERNKG